MADPDAPRKTKPVKVSQSTIDSMKQMGMQKAIAKANTAGATAEFVEGAKRMYGNRIKPNSNVQSATVTKSAERTPTPQTQRSLDQTRVPSKSTAKGSLTSLGVKGKKRGTLPGSK